MKVSAQKIEGHEFSSYIWASEKNQCTSRDAIMSVNSAMITNDSMQFPVNKGNARR